MKLILRPKPSGPDIFEIIGDEVVASSARRQGFELRSRCQDLSGTYRREVRRHRGETEFWGRVVAFSILPAVMFFYAREVGWGLAVLGIMLALPLAWEFRERFRPTTYCLTFLHRVDGDYAFHLLYFAEEESQVMDFIRELQSKITPSAV